MFLELLCDQLNFIYSKLEEISWLQLKLYKFPTEIIWNRFFYSYILGFLVDAISMYLHTKPEFGGLIQPTVDRIITVHWVWIEGFM
jgi:hypothetical protein